MRRVLSSSPQSPPSPVFPSPAFFIRVTYLPLWAFKFATRALKIPEKLKFESQVQAWNHMGQSKFGSQG